MERDQATLLDIVKFAQTTLLLMDGTVSRDIPQLLNQIT
ncbi:hypothetical protein GLO73106DRAFT_00028620 [Gloeocapsa sp. PCC 73106]|nr:hypothetical protein GLO73106DRAFT_00028620 [Gloeocapsa sp. PCC 73106]